MKKPTRVTFLESQAGIESLFTRGLRSGARAAGWDVDLIFLADADGCPRTDKDVRTELLTKRPDTVCFLMDAPLHLERLWEAPSLGGVDKISLWFDDYHRSPKTLGHPEIWTAWQNNHGVRVGIWDAYWRCAWKMHTDAEAFPVSLAADPKLFTTGATAWKPEWNDRAAFIGTIPSLSSLEAMSAPFPRALDRLLEETRAAMQAAPWPVRPYDLARACQSFLGAKYGTAIDAALRTPEIQALWNHVLWRWGKRIARLRGLAAVAQGAPLAILSGHGTEAYAGEEELRAALPGGTDFVYADTRDIAPSHWKNLFHTGKFQVQIIDPQSIEGGLPFRVFECAACGVPLLSDHRSELSELFPAPCGIRTAANEAALAEGAARLRETSDKTLRAQGRELREIFLDDHTWEARWNQVARRPQNLAYVASLATVSWAPSRYVEENVPQAGLTVSGLESITDAVSGTDHPASAASAEPLVLILANDFSLAAAKTSRHLGTALNRLGYHAIVRDTRIARWSAGYVEAETPERRTMYEQGVVAKWTKFISDYGIDQVLSLDLHWLFSPWLFLADERVRRIDSFWFDDLRSHFKSAATFPLAPQEPLELINTPKVTHHCYGRGQAEEMRLVGVERIRPSALAAPAEYLRADEPCLTRDRLAFVGNPGLPTPPGPVALGAMERGENLGALRQIARQEMLDELSAVEPTAGWLRQMPAVRDLLAVATEVRLARPHAAAISLLVEAGRALPQAFDFLNSGGHILDAALLVKLVNRYDRPALVRRFWSRGWLDVHGTPEQWKPFGISAQPTVPFSRLTSVYRRYPAHLNAPNCARDASANEKLFEIAACARLSLNLDSPDVRACYGDGEIVLAESEDALEAAVEKCLRDPDAALAAGEKARERTAREHLWEHRLEKAFA